MRRLPGGQKIRSGWRLSLAPAGTVTRSGAPYGTCLGLQRLGRVQLRLERHQQHRQAVHQPTGPLR